MTEQQIKIHSSVQGIKDYLNHKVANSTAVHCMGKNGYCLVAINEITDISHKANDFIIEGQYLGTNFQYESQRLIFTNLPLKD